MVPKLGILFIDFQNISCIFFTIKNILKIYFWGIFFVYLGHIFYIFLFVEGICSKLGLEVEHAKSNLKTFSDLGDLSLASFRQSSFLVISLGGHNRSVYIFKQHNERM